MQNHLLTVAFLLLASFVAIPATAQQAPQKDYFTIENYYKVKWGFADEFIKLWKANHYPLLEKAKENGDIITINAETPKLHNSEESRWDFKVTITFKNVALAFAEDLVTPYKAKLYPDANKLVADEKHRFELLVAHWDVPVEAVDLN
jgi:hypothetical protein